MVVLVGLLLCVQLALIAPALADDEEERRLEEVEIEADSAHGDAGVAKAARDIGACQTEVPARDPTLARTSVPRQGQPLAKLQQKGIRNALAARGMGLQDIPRALIIYEGLSMALLYVPASTRASCAISCATTS